MKIALLHNIVNDSNMCHMINKWQKIWQWFIHNYILWCYLAEDDANLCHNILQEVEVHLMVVQVEESSDQIVVLQFFLFRWFRCIRWSPIKLSLASCSITCAITHLMMVNNSSLESIHVVSRISFPSASQSRKFLAFHSAMTYCSTSSVKLLQFWEKNKSTFYHPDLTSIVKHLIWIKANWFYAALITLTKPSYVHWRLACLAKNKSHIANSNIAFYITITYNT